MATVTLRLPEDLYRRLCAASQRAGASLNQMIIVALSDALARDAAERQPADPLREQVQLIRAALGDLAVELDTSTLPPYLRPREDLPGTETLRRSMPDGIPPLSAAIIADREDRF